jgi:3-oxoacyl-[acyl-carrier protein] reductase
MEKVVLITGGSRGIGACAVEKFSSLGYKVAFTYLNSETKAQNLSAKCGAMAIKADMSISADVANAVETVLKAFGKIDILINNVGISEFALLTDITDEMWQKMINTNLSSAFFVSQTVLPDMVSQKCGRIINIGSMWGKTGASCEVHYSASKAALRGLTMALAKELGPSGITVNAIEPGVIKTDMNSALDEETMSELCDETPLCRLGEPEDVAELAYFLASDKASFITGQIIGVDGGFAV